MGCVYVRVSIVSQVFNIFHSFFLFISKYMGHSQWKCCFLICLETKLLQWMFSVIYLYIVDARSLKSLDLVVLAVRPLSLICLIRRIFALTSLSSDCMCLKGYSQILKFKKNRLFFILFENVFLKEFWKIQIIFKIKSVFESWYLVRFEQTNV